MTRTVLSINIDKQLRYKFKNYCTQNEVTMTELLIDFITSTVEKDKEESE